MNQLRDVIPEALLASTTSLVIQSLNYSSLFNVAGQIVTELIEWRSCVFDQAHTDAILEYITGDQGTARVASLMDGDFEVENMTFLQLLLAYAASKQEDLFAVSPDPRYEKVLSFLHTFFKVPGCAAIDDTASPSVLEWWTEVADDLQSLFFDSDEETDIGLAKQHLAQAALECFEKLKYPSLEELQGWDDEDRSEFSGFRRDVCDFLLAVYPMLGVELIQVFQQHAIAALGTQDWTTFETAIFCIAQLSEAVDENQHADACLNAIFFCDEFARLCIGDGITIPDITRQTLVDMLGKYQSYFERTHDLLPRVLTFLFASLDIGPCAPTASKSISYLCKSCRNALTFELPAFVNQFEQFQFKPTATAVTMERVLEGIAAIIQALPSDEEKARFLGRILRFFRQQADVAREELANRLMEPAVSRGQLVLRCLASIGKGLRADGEINVDSNDAKDPHAPTFWNTNNTAQTLIMECMQLLMTAFPLDITMIEAACDILKAGYTEDTGPYVFPPMLTVNFVKSLPLGSVGADVIMGTASAFLASHSSQPQRVRDEAVTLIIHVYATFCWMHERPDLYDPEIANSGIDFLTRLLPKYHPFLFALSSTPEELGQGSPGDHQRPPVLPTILNFTLLALQGQEPLPLRSASQFWISVFNLPSSAGPNDADPVQAAIRDCLPALCRILIARVAGQCARSDLDHLSEVIRKIIFKHQGLARPHLTAALDAVRCSDADQPKGPTMSAQEKQRFLASLMAARSARAQTVQLVRSFWVKCRGAGFDYIG